MNASNAKSLMDETHDAAAVSWLREANNHPEFPLQNLPLGLFSTSDRRRAGIAIGDHILDIAKLIPLLQGDARNAAEAARGESLNTLLALGPRPRRALRRNVFQLLTDTDNESAVRATLLPITQCQLHVPATIGDYTDFYTGIHHATNIGLLFRPDNPLLPNYKYVPIGYHGRSSSIVVSGTDINRPRAQIKGPNDSGPTYKPTQRLDYELEMGVWIGGTNKLGVPISIEDADDYIAGLCLLNDWSARDVQVWEYQPLGPFLAKNFATSISPWIVTTEALAPYRIPQPPRSTEDPKPLPYLWSDRDQASGAYAVTMEVSICTQRMRDANMAPQRLSRGPMNVMYWTIAQLLTHHTCNGCNLQAGDLLGTGTLSGVDATTFGSLIELSHGGQAPLTLSNGEQRTFLQNGDEVVFSAYAETPGRARIGFGECRGKVMSDEQE
jgi:fumarylacetoacetase